MVRHLRAALGAPLPGLDAQLRMAPRPRWGWDPTRPPPGLRDGAALLLVYPVDEAAHVPLTVRSEGLRQHTGQVSLPGGRVDPGESIEAAALREAAEEVGVVPGAVEILGRLTSLQIPVSGYLLHPVVGVARERPRFRPAASEVSRIIEAPLSLLEQRATARSERRVLTRGEEAMEVEVPYFDIDGEKVWGATAMILGEFLAIVKAAGE